MNAPFSDLPFSKPHTRRRVDDFLENLAPAIRHTNLCRSLADDVPALREMLDLVRWLLGEAAQEAIATMEQTFLEHGIADISMTEEVSDPPQSVVVSLVRHADAVAQQTSQSGVRQAVIDAAKAISPLLGEGGVSRRVAAGVLGQAASSAGVNEAAACVWALEVFRNKEDAS